MISENDIYKIGTLTRTHGVRGELSFQFTDDVWDRVEADYLFLRLDGLLVPFFLEEWRFRSDNIALLKFEDIDSADDAARLVGAEVCFPKELTPEEYAEEELTWQHFTGFEVYRTTEEEPRQNSEGDTMLAETFLGTVDAVLDQTSNILLVVLTPEGEELLIPAHEDFILQADHRQRRLLVDVPEDLLNLNN
ncbi:MAG: ribosome maturation factor RimM [Bacteroidaceae bacterium]|nr:ribosome maturation factor RimM [Bacteroidaceae bacterium]